MPMMAPIIDFSEIPPEIIHKVFDIVEFLSQHDAIIEKISPKVQKFLNKELMFQKTVYRKAYDMAFDDYILKLLKNEVNEHFDLTPEELLIIMEKDFVNIITDGIYFKKQNYKGV